MDIDAEVVAAVTVLPTIVFLLITVALVGVVLWLDLTFKKGPDQ